MRRRRWVPRRRGDWRLQRRWQPGHGVTLDVELSSEGSVVIEFDRAVRIHGRRLLKPAGRLTLAGRAGPNRFTIKCVGAHALASGTYVLRVFTELGAEQSAARSVTIDIRR